MSPAVASFLTGLAIGSGASLLGAALSYWFGLRKHAEGTGAPLAYLFLIPIALSFIGAIALLAAFVGGRSLVLLLWTGVGVIVGFTLVFAVLLFVYVRTESSP